MKNKVIHCRVTEDQQKAIASAAAASGVSITQYVLTAVLAKTTEPAD